MSTQLPKNASLEHLKKQAKTLLADFKRNEPDAIEKIGALRLSRAPKLSDAQHLVAREYGFENWSKLKQHIESLAIVTPEVLQQAKDAFAADDAPAFRHLLKRYSEFRTTINDPVGDFDSPLINHVRSRAMLDVLLEAGADINSRSRWWAGGFGLLDVAKPELAEHAIKRGAVITVHAAARLGMIGKLKEMVAADPALVHARGGDGQTPLHFASTVEIAEYLLDHGADVDVRDLDHESTPAQYMLRSRPDIARYLVGRGCKTDILMAAALGDLNLVRKHLDADAGTIRMRVDDKWFPRSHFSRAGGTIYQWELGWHVSAAQVAKNFGHLEVLELLMESSPLDEKLSNACWIHDEALVVTLLEQHADLAASLTPDGRRQLAHAARNNDTVAARLMLAAGFPVDTRGQHRGTPFHWAAWHGNAELVQLILPHHPEMEDTDNDFKASPLGWAIHGSINGWHRDKGNYPATVEALLDAGARPLEELGGSEAVQEILRRRNPKGY